ncbi:synaptotagmin-1-like [Anneissia japonica]|uniref:synaptotagmin-1-like n=1 Tax=Anneissia japonica TaxID=1529436 RepID=UPI0014254DBB|nr:synaptotagmin-1-like [Anneissia japonica]
MYPWKRSDDWMLMVHGLDEPFRFKRIFNNEDTQIKRYQGNYQIDNISVTGREDINGTTGNGSILDRPSSHVPLSVTIIAPLAGVCLIPFIIFITVQYCRRRNYDAKTEYFIYHKPMKLNPPIAFTIPKTNPSTRDATRVKTKSFFGPPLPAQQSNESFSSGNLSDSTTESFFQMTSTPTRQLSVQTNPVQYGINPVVYQITSDEDQSKIPSKYGRGKLQFSVSYAPVESQLTFFLSQVIQLPATNMRGTTDSYVQVNLIPNTHRLTYKSRMKRDTLSPQFRQYFTFIVPVSAVQAMAVRFIVFQCDENSRANSVGEVLYPLRTFDPNSSEKFEPVWMDIHQDELLRDFKQGELFLSLTYLPNASRLNVVILRSKNLKLHNDMKSCQCHPKSRSINKGKCGLYVKLSMIKAKKCCKTRQTSVKTCHLHPVFNQAFSMDLKASELEHAYIVLAVCHSMRAHGVVGRTVIGPFVYSTGDGAEHWNDMLEAPRSAVPHWHTLF